MTTAQTLQERILAAFSELSPKQQQLARFFLDNEDVVAFASASDISEQVGASPATVVRLCRSLGYEGYPDLQAAIRNRFPQYRTYVQKLSQHMSDGGFAPDKLPAQIAHTNNQNITQTMSRVSPETLDQAVKAIIQAQRIRVFGSGLSAAAAVLVEYSLTMLGLPARSYLNGGVMQTLELAQLTEKDLVIVISLWRYLRHGVEAFKAAQSVGATRIAITDSPVAPIAEMADYVFIAATEGAAHSRSLSGILSIIDLISAALVTERPQESMVALRRVDALYHESGLLLEE